MHGLSCSQPPLSLCLNTAGVACPPFTPISNSLDRVLMSVRALRWRPPTNATLYSAQQQKVTNSSWTITGMPTAEEFYAEG